MQYSRRNFNKRYCSEQKIFFHTHFSKIYLEDFRLWTEQRISRSISNIFILRPENTQSELCEKIWWMWFSQQLFHSALHHRIGWQKRIYGKYAQTFLANYELHHMTMCGGMQWMSKQELIPSNTNIRRTRNGRPKRVCSLSLEFTFFETHCNRLIHWQHCCCVHFSSTIASLWFTSVFPHTHISYTFLHRPNWGKEVKDKRKNMRKN